MTVLVAGLHLKWWSRVRLRRSAAEALDVSRRNALDELEQRMRRVLLQLALTSNAAIASRDANTGGGSARYYSDSLPQLGHGDAPQLHYARLWARACEDERRAELVEDWQPQHSRADVVRWAEAALEGIRHSSGGAIDPDEVETKEERDRRIVEFGEGKPAIEVARMACCGVRDVYAARRAASRDEERGRRLKPAGPLSPADRQARARALEREGLNVAQIVRALGVPRITVLRDLGRRPWEEHPAT
jgi:hypothetical protein